MKTMKLTIVCLLAALFMGAGSVMAQEERRDYSEQRLKLRAEMMALDMAERYNLDEKQVKELTKANLEWLQKQGNAPGLRPGPRPNADRRWADRRHHPRRGWHRGGCCGTPRRADYCCEAYCTDGRNALDCPYYDEARRPAPTKEELDQRAAERRKTVEERRAAREAYEKRLQKIMTEEQYKAYQERRPGARL